MKTESEIIEEYIDHFEHRQFYEQLTVEEQVLFRCEVRDTLTYCFFALHIAFKELIKDLFSKGE